MSEIVRRINAILSLGKKFHPDKKTVEMLSQLSKDYSSQEYPKMTPEQFLNSNATKAALSPKDAIEPYYGKAFPQELIAAGNYNIQNRVVKPESYSRVFDTIPVMKNSPDYGNAYIVGNNPYKVSIITGKDYEVDKSLEQKSYERLNNPKFREAELQHYRDNSYDSSLNPKENSPLLGQKSTLEHELGHHITMPSELSKEKGLLAKTRHYADVASNNFKDFGAHTGSVYETTQALARFQREWFKEKGTRITNPDDFVKLVDSGEIPDFLSQEGRRILIYAKNLKNVRDTSKDEEKRKAAAEAIKGLGQMAPALVQNKKKIGLNLRLG